jgi:hypothetical protein
MKKLVIAIFSVLFLCSCAVFQKKEKYGCPTDGRNVGAEKLLSGDGNSKEVKAARKAKFRG